MAECHSTCPHCTNGTCHGTEYHVESGSMTYHVCASCGKHWIV